MTFAGRPDQVREARAFVGRLLGPSHPSRDVAVLLVSEMMTNSLLHGGSGPGPGEAVTVTIVAGDAGVRGLRMVEELAVRWGYERGGGQATTWFELRHG